MREFSFMVYQIGRVIGGGALIVGLFYLAVTGMFIL